jgi:hypothetical protein
VEDSVGNRSQTALSMKGVYCGVCVQEKQTNTWTSSSGHMKSLEKNIRALVARMRLLVY